MGTIVKKVKDSEVIMTEVVCPNDTNPMGLLMGGKMLHWMDIASAVCAQTHAERICVTASIDKVDFLKPANLGDIITITAKITRSFKTSMEIHVKVWARKVLNKEKYLTNEAYLTFVAIDENGRPVAVPLVKPDNPEEQLQYDAAGLRKERRKNDKL